MTAVLEVDGLRKVFDHQVVLHDLSFTLQTGEIVGLLGANGAGKSTAIQILLGLTTATAGRVSVFGLALDKYRHEILKRCNFTSAYTSLPHNLTVAENLSVFAGLYGVRDARRKIDALLEEMGIAALRHRITGHLSSGESTRVNLCKALLNDPDLLYLDEPTASLDPNYADRVRKLLVGIQASRPITMLYTSHNMRDVEEICNRVLFLDRGRLIAQGTPREIVARFDQPSLEDVFIRVARSGDLLNPEGEDA